MGAPSARGVPMRVRSVIPGLVVAAALVLSACSSPMSSASTPTGDPTDGTDATASASPTPTPTDDFGLLRVSARATATDNGAELDLQLVVREILAVGSPELAAIWAEVDRMCSTA